MKDVIVAANFACAAGGSPNHYRVIAGGTNGSLCNCQKECENSDECVAFSYGLNLFKLILFKVL